MPVGGFNQPLLKNTRQNWTSSLGIRGENI